MSNQTTQTKPTEAREGVLFPAQQNQCQTTEAKQNPEPMWQQKSNSVKTRDSQKKQCGKLPLICDPICLWKPTHSTSLLLLRKPAENQTKKPPKPTQLSLELWNTSLIYSEISKYFLEYLGKGYWYSQVSQILIWIPTICQKYQHFGRGYIFRADPSERTSLVIIC